MRTAAPALTAAAALALAACASGNTVVHVHEARPPVRPVATPTPPPPQLLEPLEVALGRPVRGQLVVHTNRPAYVALFELVPDRGVTLVRPASAPQRRFVVSGMRSTPVWWTARRASGAAQPARYVYALASDRPLRLPDAAFEPGYLERVLGPSAYRSATPYATMRALSRHFVAAAAEEEWAEDAFRVAATAGTQPGPTARVYCVGGRMFVVPAELADRALCPPPVAVADSGRAGDAGVGPRRPS
ncbi:MAG: hypothetical protein AVDCRST_MAG11-2325, partial [uncultured Gemmatimonadaceae bacterium]